jgi:predicted amidohydrolase
VFEVGGVRVGLVICEDLWFAEPLADTAALGAELVIVPNASPFERGKGTAAGKFAALAAAGVTTVKSPGDLGQAIAARLARA